MFRGSSMSEERGRSRLAGQSKPRRINSLDRMLASRTGREKPRWWALTHPGRDQPGAGGDPARCSVPGQSSAVPRPHGRPAEDDAAAATKSGKGPAAGQGGAVLAMASRRASPRPLGRLATAAQLRRQCPRHRDASPPRHRGRHWLGERRLRGGSRRRAGPSRDGRLGTLHDLVARQPTVAVGLVLRGKHGCQKLGAGVLLLSQQLQASRDHLVVVPVATRGDGLRGIGRQLWWQGNVHG